VRREAKATRKEVGGASLCGAFAATFRVTSEEMMSSSYGMTTNILHGAFFRRKPDLENIKLQAKRAATLLGALAKSSPPDLYMPTNPRLTRRNMSNSRRSSQGLMQMKERTNQAWRLVNLAWRIHRVWRQPGRISEETLTLRGRSPSWPKT
jgi:hypothetical protein